MDNREELLAYYAQPGAHTDLQNHLDLLSGLPDDLPSLVRVVQGLLIHVFWAERYGRKLTEAEESSLQLRSVEEKLDILRQENPSPLVQMRPLERRQVGNCRDFSLVLVALLRHLGVPARARCGFGTYFLPDHYEDHWVVEVWQPAEDRWVWVDAQLDDFQKQALHIDFDSLNMPYSPNTLRSKFIPAGEAYRICLDGQADPDRFGIFEMHGMDFIRGNVVRDFLSLNKYEILPWDWGWGYLTETCFADLSLFERLSGLLVAGDEAFSTWRKLFMSEPGLMLPAQASGPKLHIEEPSEN